jgi:tetratricopeptide (TPR) repeat protein
MIRGIFVFLALVFASSAARAEWHESSSKHFVIYADQSPEEIRKYSDRLERFHNAANFKLGLPLDKKVSPSNRVTVYVLQDIFQVKKLYGDRNSAVAGFYSPRAGTTVAFVPRIDVAGTTPDFSEFILLHEYAHHLMFSISSISYPAWYIEGFAEFFASAAFEKDGSVWLGRSADHRARELAYAKPVPLERMLDTKLYNEKRTKDYDNFYGRSWLLFHYLTYDEKRKGQLTDYLRRLQNNEGEIPAANAAFGDLKVLDKELTSYLRQSQLPANIIKGDGLTPGPITVRKLSKGEAAIMPLKIQSRRGVNREQAQNLLQDMRKISAKYESDPAVLAALSEAEYDAGNSAEAIAAADRALTFNPNEINAYLQKGLALIKLAPEAENSDQAWIAVRKHFAQMNKVENDHPLALTYYYNSFQQQGKKPTQNAITGLNWALELAPFDNGLRWMVAKQEIADKKYAEAIFTLKPLAYAPHQTDQSKGALVLLQATEKLLEQSKTQSGETQSSETNPADTKPSTKVAS